NQKAAERIELKDGIILLRRDLRSVSSVDEFARWAKMRRRLDALSAKFERVSSDLAIERTAFELYVNLVLRVVVYGSRAVINIYNYRTPVFYVPANWFYPVLWFLSLPTAPMGSVSVSVWSFACNRVCKRAAAIYNRNANASEPPALPLLDSPRTSVTDFGGLTPRYHVPMYYPTEVNLYEPSVAVTSGSGGAGSRRSSAIKAEVNVPLPCGYFNFWRPLHDNATPICSKLERYFPESAPTSTTLDQWDSRISYSSADDEYYENGRLLPFIKGWNRGVLHTRNIFRNIEPDWGMSYLAPNTQSPNLQSLAVWRFNYVESRRAIRSFHAVLSYSVFSSAASIQWYIRPLSQLQFKPIPAYLLTADEAQSFPETANHKRGHSGDGDIDAASRTRARIIERHRGEILRYMDKPDEFNSYASHSVPALATDLSEHVKGEYGFEIAAAFFPESEGDNRWQKVQIARQVLNRPVGGRMLEGEDAMARCGLDFRIKLQDDVVVRETPLELRDALASVSTLAGLPPTIDDDSCDFVIRVSDPDNVVGSLQPPIRAHERVLA
ncbi:GET complex subunit get1, partial [Coemansia sp. S85]